MVIAPLDARAGPVAGFLTGPRMGKMQFVLGPGSR